MRTNAKRRKIVPIVAVVDIDYNDYIRDPKGEGVRAKEKVCQILVEKSYEFCHKYVTIEENQHRVLVSAAIRIVDGGGGAKMRRVINGMQKK